ncbi:MAG: cysteine synthase A [Negativicutes bacterium]|nr:cysteine synthase A [Negativicutes bacterium]
MARYVENILEAVGNTPLVKMGRIAPATGASIFAKVECLNPGGSIKIRTALGMITAAEEAGLLKPDSIIVEVTSGNQGISMALIGAVKGYRVRIIMPENMSIERRKLIQAYGAEVVLTPAGENIQEAIEAALTVAKRMADQDPRVFLPKQFENPANPDIHRQTTAEEIIAQLEGPLDAFVAGFGTDGTITGIGEILKKAYPDIKIIAAEPENAAILSGLAIGHHIQQGIGDGVIPPIMNTAIVDGIILVSDADALAAARRLAKDEGLLCGVSSGTNICAALRIAQKLGPAAKVVTILPDTGERYLSTELFEF